MAIKIRVGKKVLTLMQKISIEILRRRWTKTKGLTEDDIVCIWSSLYKQEWAKRAERMAKGSE